MNEQPHQIPDDILEKYNDPGEAKALDVYLRHALTIPASEFPKEEELPKKPKGRPRKLD